MLEIIKLSKQFKTSGEKGKAPQLTTILDSISFTVEPKTITCLMGCSGSGKTTLLRCICRLINFESGNICLNQIPLKALKPGDIGLVPQGYHLFEHMRVLEN